MKNLKKIPEFKNEAEEFDFWSKNNAADFIRLSESKRVHFKNIKPSTQSISIRLPESLLERIKVIANKNDVPYQSLIKMYLSERVNEELVKNGMIERPRRYVLYFRFDNLIILSTKILGVFPLKHLLETGIDMRYIQEILGHASSKTSEMYTHVSTRTIQNVCSPLDDLYVSYITPDSTVLSRAYIPINRGLFSFNVPGVYI